MREHYEAQLTTLNTEMIQMGALCEDAISGAIQALLEAFCLSHPYILYNV